MGLTAARPWFDGAHHERLIEVELGIGSLMPINPVRPEPVEGPLGGGYGPVEPP